MAALVGKTGYRARYHPQRSLPAIRSYFSAILQGYRFRKNHLPIGAVPGAYIGLMGSDAHRAGSMGLQKSNSQVQQLFPLLLPAIQLKASGSHR